MRISRQLVIVAILLTTASVFAQKNPAVPKPAKVDGVHYTQTGNLKAKNALVFVHCWTCNSQFWKDNIKAFADYRVINLDLPGHGQSDKPKVEYTMEYFARAVDRVIKHAGVQKAVLVGHSMGTPVIRRYYELFPEKTLGLVIVDGALLPMGPREQIDQFFGPLFKDYKTASATFVDGMLEPTHPSVKPYIRSSMLATPDYVGQSAMKNMLDDSYASHARINVPVLAVMAPSEFWPKDLEAKYRALAPNLDYEAMTGVSHFLQMEKPTEFNGSVRRFIAKHKLL